MATERVCSIEGCGGRVIGRGWCTKHYQRWRKHGDPTTSLLNRDAPMRTTECSVDGCDLQCMARGWCRKHYERWLRNGDPLALKMDRTNPMRSRACVVEGCEVAASVRFMCQAHHARLRKYGDVNVVTPRPVGCFICYSDDRDAIEEDLRSGAYDFQSKVAKSLGINKDVVKHHVHNHMDNPEHAEKVLRYQMARLLAARTRMEQTA